MGTRSNDTSIMGESRLQQEIMLALGRSDKLRVFRNHIGGGWAGKHHRTPDNRVVIENPRFVKFGLPEGSSDLVGWRERTITPDDVGKTIAQFVCIEIKTAKGGLDDAQKRFLHLAEEMGCEVHVIRSEEEAQEIANNAIGRT